MTRFPDELDLGIEARDQHRPCPWPSCRCTHVGCVSGWIDRTVDDGTPGGKPVAVPCPTCRPEVAAHLRDRAGTLRRRRAELPGLPRPSRHGRVDGSAVTAPLTPGRSS